MFFQHALLQLIVNYKAGDMNRRCLGITTQKITAIDEEK